MKIFKQQDSSVVFPYIAYIPDEISEKPALIIQLHGAGERGYGNNDLDKVTIHGLPKIVNDENLKNCILILPQCPSDTFWVARIESIKKFIDNVVELYNVDKKRIYIYGELQGYQRYL